MESEATEFYLSEQKAIDAALWLNFKYRQEKRSYHVVKINKEFRIVPTTRKSKHNALPENYIQMTYEQIRTIRQEVYPHNHWEDIIGLFSTTNGEILRFLLAYQVPLEKLIRCELAARGYDENHEWAGFTKAEEIWLK